MTEATGYYCDWPITDGICNRTDPELFDDDNRAYSHSRCTEHRQAARDRLIKARAAKNKMRESECQVADVVLMAKPWLRANEMDLAENRYVEWRQSR